MNITMLVLGAVLVVYLGACVHQWRRLSRKDEEATPGPDSAHLGV